MMKLFVMIMLINSVKGDGDKQTRFVMAEDVMTNKEEKEKTNVTLVFQKDSMSFVHEIWKWSDAILPSYLPFKPQLMDYQTELKHYSSRDFPLDSFPCEDEDTYGHLMRRMGKGLTSILKHPSRKSAENLINLSKEIIPSRPSSECLVTDQVGPLSAGFGAGFRVMCQDEVLVSGNGGGGGMYEPLRPRFHDYFSGSAIHVDFTDVGKVSVASGGSGSFFNGGYVLNTFPDKHETQVLLEEINENIRRCASNQMLSIEGGGGVGWKEALPEGDVESVGFGFYFKIGYKKAEEDSEYSGSGEGVDGEDSGDEDNFDLLSEDADLLNVQARRRSEYAASRFQSAGMDQQTCKSLSDDMDLCYMQKIFDHPTETTSDWYLPTIDMNQMVKEEAYQHMLSSRTHTGVLVMLGVFAVAAIALIAFRTQRRRLGYVQLNTDVGAQPVV